MDYISEAVLQLPDHLITINLFYVKKKEFDVLSDKITSARIKHTAYGELPPNKDEPRDEWLKRYAELMAKKNQPKEDETAEQYVDRLFKPVGYENNHLFLKEILAACCDLAAGQGSRITDESYQEIPTLQVVNFVSTVCKAGRIPLGELDG